MYQNSIFKKLFLGFLWVLLPVNLLLILYAAILLRDSEHMILREQSYMLKTYLNQLDDILDRVNIAMSAEFQDSDILLLQKSGVNETEDPFEWYAAQTRVERELNDWTTYFPVLQGVCAYFSYQEDAAFISTLEIHNDYKSRIRNVIESLYEQPKSTTAEWKLDFYEGSAYLSIVRRKNNMALGCWVNLNSLLSFWNMKAEEGRVYCLKDAVGTTAVVSGSEGKFLPFVEGNLDTNRMVRIEESLQGRGFSLQLYMHRGYLLSLLPGFLFALFLFTAAAITMFPILLHLIRKYVQKPVNEMMTGMEIISNGDLHYRIPYREAEGEFAALKKGFNGMVNKVLETRIEANEIEIEKKRIQIRYLTQQIQPHFILNALNILYSYEPEEFDQAQKMILCLSKYFRYIVRVQSEFTKLEYELEHICNYLEIQEARFENHFKYKVELPDAARDVMVPPLLVQNFVENSIKYALSMTRETKILVFVRNVDEKQIEVCIEDNGKGLSEDILRTIDRFKETHEYQDVLGLGIQNAIERLEIAYKGKASIEFGNVPDGGARIRICLPKWTAETKEVNG